MLVKPKMECNTVDLPAPFGPIRHSDWPPLDTKIESVQNFHLPVAGIEIVDSQMRLAARKCIKLFDTDLANDLECLAGDLVNGNDRSDAAVVSAHLCLLGSDH